MRSKNTSSNFSLVLWRDDQEWICHCLELEAFTEARTVARALEKMGERISNNKGRDWKR